MTKVTSFTIAGLLFLILAIHMTKNGTFGRLWKAISGS